MPFAFNAAAFIQALIGILTAGLCHLILLPFGFDMIGGSRELFVSLLIIAFVSAAMDIKGYKGWVIFYIPLWIVALIGAFIAFRMSNTGMRYGFHHGNFSYIHESVTGYTLFLYGSIVFIVVYYIRANRKYLPKMWEAKRTALRQLKYRVGQGTINQEECWKELSKIYWKPPNLFLHGNPVWKALYGDVPSGDEFLVFYRDFMSLIDTDKLKKDRFKTWMMEFKVSLNTAKSFSEFAYPPFALRRLGEIIDQMNGKLL
jgi:hypothetical protein